MIIRKMWIKIVFFYPYLSNDKAVCKTASARFELLFTDVIVFPINLTPFHSIRHFLGILQLRVESNSSVVSPVWMVFISQELKL